MNTPTASDAVDARAALVEDYLAHLVQQRRLSMATHRGYSRGLAALLALSGTTPLEQLENVVFFIFHNKFGSQNACVRGSPFFSAGLQTGCEEPMINDSLQKMSQNCVKYNLALVRSLLAAGYLEGEVDAERVARLISQYVQGLAGFARVNGCACLDTLRKDIAEAFYRLLGLKREYWFVTKPTWQATVKS